MVHKEPEPKQFPNIRQKLVRYLLLSKYDRFFFRTLTRLEMLMPSHWAKISTHLLIHIWEERGTLSLCGPPQSSWMFANERIQGALVRAIKQYKNPDLSLVNNFQESAAVIERRLLRGAPGYDTRRSTWVRKGVMSNPLVPPPKYSSQQGGQAVELQGKPSYG